MKQAARRISMSEGLAWDEEDRVREAIKAAVIARYDGEVARHDSMNQDGDVTWYTPLDGDDVRNLLWGLWGDWLTEETLERLAKALIEDGAEKWPLAHCEKDEEEAERERLDLLDHEERARETVPEWIRNG
jgi:hypothetical protein